MTYGATEQVEKARQASLTMSMFGYRVELLATVGEKFFFIRAVSSPAFGSAKKRELFACPSKSITKTLPAIESSFARLITVVVFPTPPLWL